MPSVFVVGDSISMQYGPHLERFLAGRWTYARKQGVEDIEGEAPQGLKGANGGDSDRVLEYLQWQLQQDDFRPDVLLLNCGLHDIKLDADCPGLQVPPERYRANLEAIVGLVSGRCRLVWMRTTPVNEAMHAAKKPFPRREADVDAYNAIADEVMAAAGIEVIDLFGISASFGSDAFQDGVHFNDDLRPIQAAYVAGALEATVRT